MNPADQRYLDRFETCSLDPATFNHRAHLRVAWLYLRDNDLESACEKTCRGIRKFARSAGDPGKFHHTLTEFLVRNMAARMSTQSAATFEEFMQQNPDLLTDARDLLESHYSRKTLHSEVARSGWVAPDLVA